MSTFIHSLRGEMFTPFYELGGPMSSHAVFRQGQMYINGIGYNRIE